MVVMVGDRGVPQSVLRGREEREMEKECKRL